MTDEPVTGCPPEVAAFIDRLVEALPESETMSSDDVLCALAIFIGGVLETMEVPAPLILARFVQALGTSMGGMAVVVSQIPIEGDEPTKH